MLWLKAFHIIFTVAWFAGLFYLPRLFVYHSMASEQNVRDTLKVMERKLMLITHISGALSILFGVALLWGVPVWLGNGWMQVKLGLVLLLVAYHIWCFRLVGDMAADRINHTDFWYRCLNEIPALVLVCVVLLVVLRPF
jgi:putative membrane protein